MVPELPDPGLHKVIVGLPEVAADELVPACEVLCQEGFTLWTLGVTQLEQLPVLRGLFGRRARIGVHGVTEPAQIITAAAGGAVFAMSDFLLSDLPGAVPGFPVVLGGLTPSELRAGAVSGAAAVQLVPSEAFGTGYARILPNLLAGWPVIASGKLERYQAELWLEAGGVAVCPRELVGADAVSGDSLDGLRVALQHWRFGD